MRMIEKMPAEVKIIKEKLEFDDVVSIYLRFMRIVGLAPFEGCDYNFLGSRILLVFFFLTSIINWSMFVFYCFNASGLQIDAICEAVIVVSINSRFYIMIERRFKFAELLNECRSIWNEFCADEVKCRETVMEFERKLRILLMCYLGSAIFINILYPAVALTTRLPPLEPNGTERRILPYKWYGNYDENQWPGYGLTFALQMLVVQNAIIIGVTVDIVPSLLIMITSAYFRNLRDRFILSADNEDGVILEVSTDNELVRCSKIHQKILNFSARINKMMEIPSLIQLSGSAYNISLIGIKLISSDPDKYKYASILSACICQMFICQWAPDHLFTESAAISEAVYSACFTWLKRRLGKMIVIITSRAHRPVQITAGGIVNLSLENFGSMITSAISFFTMLRNFDL